MLLIVNAVRNLFALIILTGFVPTETEGSLIKLFDMQSLQMLLSQQLQKLPEFVDVL